MNNKMKIVIIGAGPSSILKEIVAAIDKQNLLIEILAVIGASGNPTEFLATAEALGLATQQVSLPKPSQSKGYYDQCLMEAINSYHPDIIVLIGYARILSSEFVKQYENKIFNIHGSLLPKYAGLMGEETQKAVLAAGDKLAGCTVHIVIDEVDAGPILSQMSCEVSLGDTPRSLREKLIPLASHAYITALKDFSGSPQGYSH